MATNEKASAPEETERNQETGATTSRRSFFGTAGAVTAGVVLQPLFGGKSSVAEASVVGYNSAKRVSDSADFRESVINPERINVGVQPDNGDAARFPDFSGMYSKALAHDALGVPNAASWNSMKNALTTGKFADFENIVVGTPGGGGNSKLNGPQGSFAFDLEGLDSHATVIPPSPSVASAQTAAEQVEQYWAALLRDVPFSGYATSSVAAQAVSDMNRLSFLASGQTQFPYPVTTANLFRGQVTAGDGNAAGPYLSQFLLQPTFFGSQPLSQQYQTYLPLSAGGANYMTSPAEYQLVQNGGNSGRSVVIDPTFRYVRNGRDLCAYTRVDVLYQAYFTAFLVLAQLGTPANPGLPYAASRTEKAFGTLGGPDLAGTLAEMATRALKAAWFHKWVVDLRMRPEEYGALVHARLARTTPQPQAAAALHPDMLNSAVLPLTNGSNGSYLLSQSFPEGSPTHPCYPTGHGTVGGACITAIKFFLDCNRPIRPLLTAARRDVSVPSADGLSLNTYTGADANSLTIAGELVKLGFNITFGHGIHAGIHFRSSSYWSLLLGEQVALSVLKDRAQSYNEPFSVTITKFDGTTTTITNSPAT